MGPIEDSLREDFFPELFGEEEVSADLIQILGHSVKHGDLSIPDPHLSAERVYNTYKSSSEVLAGSLLGGTNLNYVAYKACVRRVSADRCKHR